MEYIDPRLIDTNPMLAHLLPEALARECNVVAQRRQGGVLHVLIGDPYDEDLKDKLMFIFGTCSELCFSYSSGEAIKQAVDRIYGGIWWYDRICRGRGQ
jgi:hypothetical protein